MACIGRVGPGPRYYCDRGAESLTTVSFTLSLASLAKWCEWTGTSSSCSKVESVHCPDTVREIS